MFDILFNLGCFLFGMGIGKARGINTDITKQTDYMQDLIDKAYESRDAMKQMWIDAEQKAETWERRYWNLFEEDEEENEEE
jgi:hypothetical protein